MAQSGTLTQTFDNLNRCAIAITGMTQGTNSPPFNAHGFPFTSAVVSGTAGAGSSFQWQGSNDGGTSWVNVGTSFASLPTGGSISPNNEPFDLYQLVITGGDATTNVNVYVKAVRAG